MSRHPRALLEVFLTSLKLGLTSFGGPIAHLAYFRDEYVSRRRWIDDHTYADLVALCQFLPGPASSQVGIAIGMIRAGIPGGVVAWVGFTMPSAIALIAFAEVLGATSVAQAGWLRGLMIVAVAVVAHAVWGMATKLSQGRERATLTFSAAAIALLWPSAITQVLLIIAGGFLGRLLLAPSVPSHQDTTSVSLSRRGGLISLSLFAGLLIFLPIARHFYPAMWLAMVDSFYRVGSLVFGGGHVVLPLLQSEVVTAGWLSENAFLAGYGATQAVPGPLFTFSVFIGAMTGGWGLALIALVAIFAPSFFLIVGTLPLWQLIRHKTTFRAVLDGINATVVGILLAALYDPIWIKAIFTPADFTLALLAFGLLTVWKVPAWAVVVFCAAGGLLISR